MEETAIILKTADNMLHANVFARNEAIKFFYPFF